MLIVAISTDLGIGVCVLLLYKFQPFAFPETVFKGFVNVNLAVLSIAAASLAFRDSRRAVAPDRTTRWLLAVVLALFAAGEIVCLVQDWALGDREWPVDGSGLFWLVSRACLMVLLVRAGLRNGPRPPLPVMGGIYAVTVLVLVFGARWALIPMLDQSDDHGFSILIESADLLCLGAWLIAMARGGFAWTDRPLWGSLFGVAVILATDQVLHFDMASERGAFVLGEMGYFSGYLLVAWAHRDGCRND